MKFRTVFLLLILAACSAPPTLTPTILPLPTVTLISVYYPIELEYVLSEVQACRSQVPESGILTFESLIPPLPDSANSLTIWLGEPPLNAGYVASLGEETIAIYVNKDNLISGLEASAIRDLFSGLEETWGDEASPVTVWFPLNGSVSARTFEQTIGSIRITPNGFLAPSPVVAAEQVSKDPGAITVLPSGWETPGIRRAQELAKLPVTVLTQGEPIGLLREFVSCLQQAQLFNSP